MPVTENVVCNGDDDYNEDKFFVSKVSRVLPEEGTT